MSEPPVLAAIRALIKFKGSASIAEIARMSGKPQRHVLDLLNRNREFIKLDKRARVASVVIRAVLRDRLWKSGAYYRPGTYGAWSVEGYCLTFEGNAELRESLQEKRWIGGFGDSSQTTIVIDTPENRAALEAAGLRPWQEGEALIDDRLWEGEE